MTNTQKQKLLFVPMALSAFVGAIYKLSAMKWDSVGIFSIVLVALAVAGICLIVMQAETL